MAETVPLLVPKKLLNRVDIAGLPAVLPVQMEPYGKVSKTLLQRVAKEQVILLADAGEFTALLAQDESLRACLEGKCRIVLMYQEGKGGLPNLPVSRCLDVVDAGASAELLSFRIARALADMEVDGRIAGLESDMDRRRNDLEMLNQIGMALSTEKDLDRLLEMIVSHTRLMTYADAGSLYLIEKDPNTPEDQKNYFADKKMRFQVAQSDTRSLPFQSFLAEISKQSIYGYVALTQEYLNFEDVYFIGEESEVGWGGREFDAATKYRTMSMLTVPMVNWRGETIGVIQLINRKLDPKIMLDDPATAPQYIRPFTQHDVRMALSIASQASIAIQNTRLVDSIQTLFDGFIDASVKAIESRDPTTAGHSGRVAELTVALAEKVDGLSTPAFKEYSFSREDLQEIRYASLLHDFGKIGVREHVLVKAKKLFPPELRGIEDRFDLIRAIVALNHSMQRIKLLERARKGGDEGALMTGLEENKLALAREIKEIEEIYAFVLRCNEPTVLAEGGFEQLHDVAARVFEKLNGEKIPFISQHERLSLSVPRGSLTEDDRKEIESHVTHTYRFLSAIPWTQDLRQVAEIAYAHHEKLDGTGYPNRLNAAAIPIQAKMMSISDIFDALTASDRPYKKALPAERALNILLEETRAHHVDAELLEVFINSEVYKIVL